MPTLNQLIRHGREEKRRTDRTRASDQCPQKQGVRPRVSTRTPKKPNSAPRKIAKVRLSNRHDIFAHIPGEGHNSQEHSMVLIRGGRVKDSPGVKSHCIRGVKDLQGIPDRRRGRSKYGTEKPIIGGVEFLSEGKKKTRIIYFISSLSARQVRYKAYRPESPQERESRPKDYSITDSCCRIEGAWLVPGSKRVFFERAVFLFLSWVACLRQCFL